MQPSMFAILLTFLAISSAYAQNSCLLADNCASCSDLDTVCGECDLGYGLYAGDCYACPAQTFCAYCNTEYAGNLQVETTCSGLFWYWYAICAGIVISLLICCCTCCCRRSKETIIITRQPDSTSVKVQATGYPQQQGWNQPSQNMNVNY